ncbi:hypothetical protein QLQ80_01215 [Mycoplasma sp. M5725]|uniref:MOLPALP family lipoprotein n=1 Tax=Mycoplasma phocimorsus TaxID=3045839 RepID=A0AAJ1PS08_9MOLU|nr:hypothetical protein [Mycoplasma phocimorsus]MDJ1645708.1 hypothetical protein [Mycoplasma phocimorsus]
MNKKRMLVNIVLATMSLATTASVLSCNKTKTFKTESFQQFQNQKTNSHFSFIDKNTKSDTSSDFLHSKSFEYENNLNENIIEDEQLDNDNEYDNNEDNLIINEQEEVIDQELEITRQQLLELEKRNKKDSAKNSHLKLVLIGAGISSAVVSGLSIGIGTYFGITKSDAYAEKRKKELTNILNIQKSLINQINPDDKLEKIFLKLLDIGFDKQLPTGIFDLFDTLLFKKALKNHITEEEKERFKSILKDKIKDRSKEIVKELLHLLKTKKILAKTSDDNVINSVKNIVSIIIKKYLPDFVKATLIFISEINKNDNDGTSLLGKAIKALLDFAGYNSGDCKTLSKIFYLFSNALSNSNNDLIKIIIRKISKAIDETNLTFNLFEDLFQIIKRTIWNILTKPNSDELDINSIFNKIVPAFLKVFEDVANETKNGEDFVVFVNSLFTETNEGDKTKKALYTILLNDNKEMSETEKNILKQEVEKLIKEKINNTISTDSIFNISVSFFTILNAVFKIGDVKNLIIQFLNTFLKPLIKIAKEYEEKQKYLTTNLSSLTINGINVNAPYKAIIRIYSLYSFLYYKYVPEQKGMLGNLISWLNPFEPKKFITNLIKKEWANITDMQLFKLFGEYISKEHWYSIKLGPYKIFDEIKNYAISNNISKFKELIKNIVTNTEKNNIKISK